MRPCVARRGTLLAFVVSLNALVASWAWCDDEGVEAGREALRSSGRVPWYDRQRDALRPVPITLPPGDPANRGSRWEMMGDDPTSSPAGRRGDASWLNTVLEAVGWIALIGLLVALTIVLVRAYLRSERRKALIESESAALPARTDSERIENLPFPVAAHGDFLVEARRCYEAGEFSQAIVFLFSYQLVRLDREQFLHLTRGKTNRQYLRELRPHAGLSQMFATTMTRFEEVFFGKHPLDRPRFEECWLQLDAFHALLQR